MDFTPHSDADVARMLGAIGLADVDDLFAHLPPSVRIEQPLRLPAPLAEPDVMDLVDAYGAKNRSDLVCFAGGGIYDHFLPPVVRTLTMRPEFVTAYTPYQPEVSQGILQVLFEFQSMVAEVMGLDVANASLYDGVTAVVEAMNMAVAATRRNVVWVSRGLSPRARESLATFAAARDIEIIEHPMVGGKTAWDTAASGPPAAVIFGQPNYVGVVEDYDQAVTAARDAGALAVALVDPMTLGLLRSPGSAGVDIAVAEGQPLGNPMSFGGPVVGLLATKLDQVRRIPGRLIGQTVDADGRTAYVMTLRTREQDIRREKASSNICTNQSLNAVAAAVHLAWLGPQGLAEVGRQSAAKARYLAKRLDQLPGVRLATDAPFVREFPVLLPIDAPRVLDAMAERGFLAGLPLAGDYPEFPGGLLVAVTERRTRRELDGFADALKEVIADG